MRRQGGDGDSTHFSMFLGREGQPGTRYWVPRFGRADAARIWLELGWDDVQSVAEGKPAYSQNQSRR